MSKIHPCLWFENQSVEAANFYCSVFKNSKIVKVTKLFDDPFGRQASTVELNLDGQRVLLLDDGPHFKQTEAFSFIVDCADQAEVDYYWDKLLSAGGKPSQCGWLKDQFGLSWQITPRALIELTTGADTTKAKRVWDAMMTMQKIDVATLQKAYRGEK